MTWYVWTLVPLALAIAGILGVMAWRRPILFRMAVRNASRRPRQTTTVIAGLMIGTAIISAALVAGQSAGTAIRGTVYDALGVVDETVRLDSFSFFSEDVLDSYLADPDVTGYFDGISANVIWGVAAENDRTELFEPDVAVVGYDPERDKDFRPFILGDGSEIDGSNLQDGQAIVNQELAEAMDVEIGDVITIRYTDPVDPLVPEIFAFNGTIAASAGGATPDAPVNNSTVPGGLGSQAENATRNQTAPTEVSHWATVDQGSTRFVAVLAWPPGPDPNAPATTQMSLKVRAPNGTTWTAPANPNATVEIPLVLDIEAPKGEILPPGNWTVTVSAVAAANTPYQGASVVLYPIYDLAELQERTKGLDASQFSDFSDFADGLDPFGEPKNASVEVVAITTGGRGIQFDMEATMFVTLDRAQQWFDRENEVNVIKFSNPGDIIEGREGTQIAEPLLRDRLIAVQAASPLDPAVQQLDVFTVKEKYVELADDAGATLTGLLLFAGSLSVITGLLLIINIFTMLAEERRSELGMARAVGLSRGDLIRLFLFEGSLYAIAAAAIGAILGLGLAALLVAGLNTVMQNLDAGFPAIQFSFDIGLILAAFAAGALLTFMTIAWSSRRIAKLNIVRAIRSIEEPEKTGSRIVAMFGIPVAVAGVVLTIIGWIQAPAAGAFTMQIFGGLAAVMGAGMALKRKIKRRHLYPILAGLLLAYYTFTYFTIGEFDNLDEANLVGPIRGVILTLCVVIIVVHVERGPRALGRLLGRFKGMRAVALPAVSYPQHKRFRTGMTLAMFSIVILSIGFFSIFGGLFDRPTESQTGGYHVEATTTLDVEDISLYDRGLIPEGTIDASAHLRYFRTVDIELITVNGEQTGHFGPPRHYVFGMEEDFVESQNFRLLWRLDGYDSDAAAYQDVLDRDDVVIVSYQYSTDEQGRDLSHEVGETLTIHLGDSPKDFTIIGIQEQYHLPGIFLDQKLVDDMFPTSINSFYLYKLTDGADHEETAKLLERNYRDVGMDAEASEVLVNKEQEAFRQILGAMKLFLGLGLIVGVLSLGIVTARSVIERRQEIGMLRALGYTKKMIRRIFMTEMTAIVAMGAIIGIACSILVSFGLWFVIIRELQYPYTIPWSEILILVTASYAVALLATMGPIRRASRVAPAEALRYIE